MTTVSLDRSYLHLASDPSQFVPLKTLDKSENPFVNGSVNQYSAGRFRYVGVEGVSDNDDLTFTLVAEADRLTLKSWCGRTVIYRDPHGTKHTGAYLTFKTTEETGVNYADLEIQSLLTVTFSEAQ